MSAWAVPLRQGALEGDADAAARERRDGVMGEGRAQEVAADSLELLAVAAVGGGRGVEIHAEGGGSSAAARTVREHGGNALRRLVLDMHRHEQRRIRGRLPRHALKRRIVKYQIQWPRHVTE
jgi:hypothetical protein